MITFKELYESVDEDFRYLLDERAAIHEFDGRMKRGQAEQQAVIDLFLPCPQAATVGLSQEEIVL